MDAMLGLVVTAIGLMTIVIAFTQIDSKKRMISYGIAGIVTVSGLFYFVSAEMRGHQMRQRISKIQRQQRVNLEEIQKRLRKTQPAQAPVRTPPPAR